MNNKLISGGVILAIVLSLFAILHQPGLSKLSNSLGATSAGNLLAENYIPYVLYNGGYNSAKDLNITGGATFGSSGTTFNSLVGTTCNLIGSDASQVASSSKVYDCAVTGVTSSSIVIAQLATSTTVYGPSAGCPGWFIAGSKASSTAGFVTVSLVNDSCAAAVPSVTGVGSSTAVWTFR